MDEIEILLAKSGFCYRGFLKLYGYIYILIVELVRACIFKMACIYVIESAYIRSLKLGREYTVEIYPRHMHPVDTYPRDTHPKDMYPGDTHPRDMYPKDMHPGDMYLEICTLETCTLETCTLETCTLETCTLERRP